mgnify:CR=1 FL=1
MIADIIIIAILALSIFLGYRKGLVELGIKLVSVIIAIVLTLILYRPITNIIINTTSLDENLEQAILNQGQKIINPEEQKEETNQIQNPEQEIVSEVENHIQNEMLPEAARELSINIIRACVMLILYIVIKIALRFVTALANLVAKLPILNQFNKLGGIIYGAIRGLLIIYVLLLLISFFGQVNPQNKIHTEIQNSFITKEMYNKNIINLLIK